MPETILHAESGRPTGSAAARRLRSEDQIPAVVYGRGMDPLTIAVTRRDLRVAVSGPAGMNTILDLTVDGSVYPAIIKDVQRHPVRLNIEHVDFIQVDLNAEIVVSVPIRMLGEAKAVLANGGLVDLTMGELEVSTTPRNIPDEITVDVSEMDMDTTIRVEDLEIPEGVTSTADPDAPVVTVLTMRAPIEEELEELEGEEGEEGVEGAEGAAEDDGESAASDDAGE